MGILVEMNSGLPQFSQVGKFLTIYPRSTTEAVKFAALLHRLTRDLRGPEIPFDKRYRRNSIVYYRYGAFRSKGKRSEDGTLRDPAGKIHQDERAAGRAVPTWLEDPFQKAGARPPRPSGRIGLDYLPFRTLSQRGKGGVYEALDLSVSPARRVILKEGRPQGEIDFRGRDGCARVRHEARVLRRLHRRGLPVPKVMAEFGQGGKRFLVLEKLSGRPLFSEKRGQPANPSWRRAEKILNQLQPLLARIHATGWVWRDCKPSHILIRRGGMHLIDFEGACRINDTTAMPWSSPHYIRPEKKRGLARRRGTWEDDYALGVIAFQCLTGEFPSLQARERKRVYRREACAGALRDRIERLLVGP
ncbi:MAG: phosphotransferase [Chthoniobacterales bacterium]